MRRSNALERSRAAVLTPPFFEFSLSLLYFSPLLHGSSINNLLPISLISTAVVLPFLLNFFTTAGRNQHYGVVRLLSSPTPETV